MNPQGAGPSLAVRYVAAAGALPEGGEGFVYDGPRLRLDTCTAAVLLPVQGASRARELLLGGAPRVYLGHAALADAESVRGLAAEFGGGRLGIFAPVARMEVSWAIDSMSNADFKFMTPSVCEPCWEVLDGSGARTGTHAAWWIGEMLAAGASSALVRVRLRDDTDLNICAGLVERFGERLWVSPENCTSAQLEAWAPHAKLRQVALPAEALAAEQVA